MIFSVFRRMSNHLIPEYFHHPRKKPFFPLVVTPQSLLPKQLVYFLSPWNCLFWGFHINGIMLYVAFASGFFHSVYYFQDSSML